MRRMIVTFTGPSGVGKSTIRRELIVRDPKGTVLLPMYTTRIAKEGDEGEYIHLSPSGYVARSKKGAFVASTRVASGAENRQYAYAGEEIERAWQEHRLPLLVTDLSLLQQLIATFGCTSVLSVFLMPPGDTEKERLRVLEGRLQTRGRDTDREIVERLRNASRDIRLPVLSPQYFHHTVINDLLLDALQEVQRMIDISLRGS